MAEEHTLDIHEADRRIADRINASPHAKRLLTTLCRQVGPRPAGSAAMRQAAGLLAGEWRSIGAREVHTERVPVLAWEEGESSVRAIGPTAHSLDSVHCVNSAPGTVSGALVVAGESELAGSSGPGRELRGAIVLMKGHEVSGGKYEPMQRRISRAERAGAAAVLLAGRHPDLPVIDHMYRPVSVPVVSLPGKQAARLAELASRNALQVRIEAEGRCREASCVNLVGTIGPQAPAGELVVLSAHLDGYYLSPCAFDNLTGIVALTETARALSRYSGGFARSLRIIAYTGEECGFAGSKEYVRAHVEELDRVRFVLNLDGLFDDTASGLAVMWSPEMREYIAHALSDLNAKVDVRDMFCMSSDYLPFLLAGVAAGRPASFTSPFPPWSHTVEDTEDKIDLEWLRANALLCARVLLKMLTDRGPLPSMRKTAQEVRELVRAEQAEDALYWVGAIERAEAGTD